MGTGASRAVQPQQPDRQQHQQKNKNKVQKPNRANHKRVNNSTGTLATGTGVDETFNAIYADAQKYGTIDVMLSINCWTMEKSALGVSVWMCTSELQAGDNYRDGIFQAVKGCRVLIPFINQKWAKSGECEYEFSLAVRTNLISHDSNKTSRVIQAKTASTGEPYSIPGIRRPAFLPIKFPDIEWTENPAVEQLSCSTNFVVCDSINLLDGTSQTLLLPKILNGLYNLGIKIQLLPTDPPLIPMAKRSLVKKTNPVDLAQQVISGIQFQLQNAQDLNGGGGGNGATAGSPNGAMFSVFPLNSLYRQYLGYCANERSGCEVIWSLEFLIEPEGDFNHQDPPLVGTCEGDFVTDVSDTVESRQTHDLFNAHVKDDHCAVAFLKGKFDRRRGLVVLDAYDKDDPYSMIRLCKYRIVLEQGPDGNVEDEKNASRAGKQALGLFNPIIENPKKEEALNEWTAVIRLVATA
ncbi:hypothetical protein BDR26DRAFT_873689 [Obelidium mucronatum]|nr:hypothetical protein BDR26DRAFT_873689 [Obelidium mucronatum]